MRTTNLNVSSVNQLRTARLFIPAAALLVAPCAAVAQASSPFVIEGPTIVESTCNQASTTMESSCFSVNYPQGSPIAQNRYITVPRGNVEFDFPVISSAKVNLGASFNVTVTADNVNPGSSIQGAASVKFASGSGSAVLKIPLNLDWAESVVTMQIVSNQENCIFIHPVKSDVPPPPPKCSVISSPPSNGPALPSTSNLPQILPLLTDPNTFVVLVTPAALVQLDALPVAIVYAPLGNTTKAQSSLTMSAYVATNISLGTTGESSYATGADDKTGYTGGVSF
jgi:hypothetical protein